MADRDLRKVIEVVVRAVDQTREVLRSVQQNLDAVGTSATTASASLTGMDRAAQAVSASLGRSSAAARDEAASLDRTRSATQALTSVKERLQSVMQSLSGTARSVVAEYARLSNESGRLRASALSVSDAVGKAIGIMSELSSVAFPVVSAAQFERKLTEAMAVMGASGEEIEIFRQKALDLGRTTEFTASQAAEGFLMLGRAGVKGAEALGALPTALNLAMAGAMDLGQATDIVTNIMTSFRLGVEELPRVADMLTAAFTNSNSTLVELGESFKYVGSIASGVGGDFADVTAALGALHNAGMKGSMAGTALRGTLSALLNPTREEAELMDELSRRMGGAGLQIMDAQGRFVGFVSLLEQLERAGITAGEALELFGDRAGTGMAALLGQGSEAVRKMLEAVRQSEGETDRIAVQMNTNLVGAWRNFQSAVEGLAIAIGDRLKGPLTTLLVWLTDQANLLVSLSQQYPGLTSAVVYLTTAFVGLSAAIKAISLAKFLVDITGLTAAFHALQAAVSVLGVSLTTTLGPALATVGFAAAAEQVRQLVMAMTEASEASQGLRDTAAQYQANAQAFLQYKDTVVQGESEIAVMREEQLRAYYEQLRGALQYYQDMITALEAQAQERNWLLMSTEEAEAAQEQLVQVRARYDELMTALTSVGARARELGVDLVQSGEAQKQHAASIVDAASIMQEQLRRSQEESNRLHQAIQEFFPSQQKVIENFTLMAQSGQVSAQQILAAFQTVLRSISTTEDLDLLRQALQQLGDTGKLSMDQVKWAMDEVDRKARGLAGDLDPVTRAFRTLHIESAASLQRTADEARQAFDLIRHSGTATVEDIKAAFRAYAQAAIKAAEATGDTFQVAVLKRELEAQQAAYGLRDALVEAGQAGEQAGQKIASSMAGAAESLKTAEGSARQAADSMRQSSEATDEAVQKAEEREKEPERGLWDWKKEIEGFEQLSDTAQRRARELAETAVQTQYIGLGAPGSMYPEAKPTMTHWRYYWEEMKKTAKTAIDEIDKMWSQLQKFGMTDQLVQAFGQWKQKYGDLIDPSQYRELAAAVEDYQQSVQKASEVVKSVESAAIPSAALAAAASAPAATRTASAMDMGSSQMVRLLERLVDYVADISRAAGGMRKLNFDELAALILDRLEMHAART